MWITNAQYSDIAYVYTRTGSERKTFRHLSLKKILRVIQQENQFTKWECEPLRQVNWFLKMQSPKENLVGEEGDSIYHMMKNLDIERITIAGISLGIAQACVDQSVKYATEDLSVWKAYRRLPNDSENDC